MKDRQKDRELDRWTYEKRIGKQTSRCKHKLMERQTDGKMNRQRRDRQAGAKADRQGKSQTKKGAWIYGQTDGKGIRQIDEQTDRHVE